MHGGEIWRRQSSGLVRLYMAQCYRRLSSSWATAEAPSAAELESAPARVAGAWLMHACMYVCMVITYSRIWTNRVRLLILLVVS